jgi:prepilin-type N-terminal cleavage/methylation domain-containing protein
MKNTKQNGFTFIELMLVITFIGIASAGLLRFSSSLFDYPKNADMNQLHTQVIGLIRQSYAQNAFTGMNTFSLKDSVIPGELVRGTSAADAFVKTPYRSSTGVYEGVAANPNQFTATYTNFPPSSCGAFIADKQKDAVSVSIGGVNVKALPGTPFSMTLLNTNCTLSTPTSDFINPIVFTYEN